MKKISIALMSVVLLSSCVSKKKYVALQDENGQIKSELAKTTLEKEELEEKFEEIEKRVATYNDRINSLTEEKKGMMVATEEEVVISENARAQMQKTLAEVDPALLASAKTLKDSMNIAVAHQLEKRMSSSDLNEEDDIAVNIDETVVMISIADEFLFNTASFRVNNKADHILAKIAAVINAEPSIEVMVEGHTDARTVMTEQLRDNWDLSVLRASSVVRKLQNEFNVAPEKMIASGRSSYHPVADNDTREGRAKNRRTRIVILPNIDKFFALMANE